MFIDGLFAEMSNHIDAQDREKDAPLIRRDLAPSETSFTTLTLPQLLSTGSIPKLQEGGLFLYFVGLVKYTDAYGGSYRTDSCYIFFGTDTRTWHFCGLHNRID
jgi:hypothetical protein